VWRRSRCFQIGADATFGHSRDEIVIKCAGDFVEPTPGVGSGSIVILFAHFVASRILTIGE